MAYKPDQGRMARMAAFWSLAILIYYGCYTLNVTLQAYFEDTLGKPLADLSVPVIGIDLTPAFLITAVLCVGGVMLLYRWTQKPKIADLLIDTETELRKVTWPSLNEAISSSVIVILCVVVLMAFLAGSDYVLGRWANFLLVGRG